MNQSSVDRSHPTTSKLTVAFVAGTYQPDRCGVADYTDRLRGSLRDRGVESLVLTTRAAAQGSDATVRGVVEDWGLVDVWKLAQAIRSTSAHLLHIQHAAGTYGFRRSIFLLPMLLRFMGCRLSIVTTVHEYGWWEWQPKLVPPKLLEQLKQWGQQRGYWDREDGFLLTGSQALITTNANVEAVICDRLPHLRDRLHSIPIGANVAVVPVERLQARSTLRQQFQWSAQAEVIAFFGFLHPVKGLETLLAAFQQVLSQQPQSRLLLIGGVESLALPEDAAKRYWNKLHAQVQELGLDDRVQFTNYVSAETASQYLSGCDIGILPFNHGVTLKSGSLLTLLAHRLPVIATLSDPPDPALNDRLVEQIPPRDITALMTALLRLLQDPEKRDRLANSGYAFGQQFNWDTIAQNHLEIYAEVVRRSESRSSSE